MYSFCLGAVPVIVESSRADLSGAPKWWHLHRCQSSLHFALMMHLELGISEHLLYFQTKSGSRCNKISSLLHLPRTWRFYPGVGMLISINQVLQQFIQWCRCRGWQEGRWWRRWQTASCPGRWSCVWEPNSSQGSKYWSWLEICGPTTLSLSGAQKCKW